MIVRRLVFFALLLVLPAARALSQQPGPSEELGFSSQRLARLERVIQDYIDKGRIPGAVMLVRRAGKVAFRRELGWIDVEGRVPMRADTIFRLASMTKPITSVGIMILHEEGALLLSDPVSKYITELADSTVAGADRGPGMDLVAAKRKITIRDLLSHTAGISYGDGASEAAYRAADVWGWSLADRDETIGEFVRRLAVLPFEAQPGERWVYGYGTDILGHVIERVSGLTLAEFFQQRILGPLKMRDTHFFLPAEKMDRFTPIYGVTDVGGIRLLERAAESDYAKAPRRCYSGGAGLLSTTGDYARFLRMLLNEGELDGARILGPKTVRLMTANHVGDLYPTEYGPSIASGHKGFGLGFWVNEDLGGSGQLGSVGSYGWEGAYYTTFWVDPKEKLFAVFMTHLLPTGEIDLHGKLNALIYQALLESYSDSAKTRMP